jgi:1,4-dihydroxy-2-naphthoyl-CoA hydrolase
MLRPDMNPDVFHRRQQGTLPAALGIAVEAIESGEVRGALTITPAHMAPNGFLHAASVIALADTMAGYGALAHLPENAKSFTTVELKSNFLGTAREGCIRARATAVHLGRNTQVWDAVVTNEAGKTIALFRCTQMILY